MFIEKSHFPGILSDIYNVNPYVLIDNLNKSEDVIFDETLNSHLAISYDAVRHILKNHNIYTTKPLAERAEPVMKGKVLAQMEGEEHRIKRHIILQQFTGNILKYYYKLKLIEIFDSLIIDLSGKDQFNFIAELGNKFAILSTFEIIGIDHSQFDWFHVRLKNILKFAIGFNLSEGTQKSSLLSAEELESAILKLIDERKISLKSDIISFILKDSEYNNIINDSDIVALTLNILLAASEPVDKVLANCIYHLYRNKNYTDKLLDGSCSHNLIIQECLRLTPPVHLIPRLIEVDSCIGGVNLRAGELIYSLIPSANRDEKYFISPSVFAPYRSYKSHLSYGAGMHVCIGAQFANMQLSIALEKLVPIINSYVEAEPPKFDGVYTRGAIEYYLKRV